MCLPISGTTAPPAEQQLATCLSQLHCLATDMQACMAHTTQLHLTVRHTLQHSSTEASSSTPDNSVLGCCSLQTPGSVPASLEPLLNAVLVALAAAVPHVQELTLGKGSGESAIRAFGSLCLQLSSLGIDVIEVPTAALRNVSQHLPRLTHLRFSGRKRVTSPFWSLDPQMVHLQHCALLQVLSVDFDGDILISAQGFWDLLPASLEEYSCNCRNSYDAIPLRCGPRLKRLSMRENPKRKSVPRFLQAHPHLQELDILETSLNWPIELLRGGLVNTDPTATTMHPLRERFATGFKFRCRKVSLSGSSKEVEDALAWLPPLPSVTDVGVHLDGINHDQACLQQIARVFPSLESLYVKDGLLNFESALAGSDVGLLAPLLACTRLRHLFVCIPMAFTTKWLFQLCVRLFDLELLRYMPCPDANHVLLRGALSLMDPPDRNIRVELYHAGIFDGASDDESDEAVEDDLA